MTHYNLEDVFNAWEEFKSENKLYQLANENGDEINFKLNEVIIVQDLRDDMSINQNERLEATVEFQFDSVCRFTSVNDYKFVCCYKDDDFTDRLLDKNTFPVFILYKVLSELQSKRILYVCKEGLKTAREEYYTGILTLDRLLELSKTGMKLK